MFIRNAISSENSKFLSSFTLAIYSFSYFEILFLCFQESFMFSLRIYPCLTEE